MKCIVMRSEVRSVRDNNEIILNICRHMSSHDLRQQHKVLKIWGFRGGEYSYRGFLGDYTLQSDMLV